MNIKLDSSPIVPEISENFNRHEDFAFGERKSYIIW